MDHFVRFYSWVKIPSLTNSKNQFRTETCRDPFYNETALKSGVQRLPCVRGVCMKMWFRESEGRIENILKF